MLILLILCQMYIGSNGYMFECTKEEKKNNNNKKQSRFHVMISNGAHKGMYTYTNLLRHTQKYAGRNVVKHIEH